MADKKNLVEEALLQMENLQEAITNNAKGILASTMKEEISELVKESLHSDEEVEVSETETEEETLKCPNRKRSTLIWKLMLKTKKVTWKMPLKT